MSKQSQAGTGAGAGPGALYLLPFGYQINATGTAIVGEQGEQVLDLAGLPRQLTLGLGAFQPLQMAAAWPDGTFSYAGAEQVDFVSAKTLAVQTHFDEELGWSGVEGCAYTEAPVKVTARWRGEGNASACIEVRVEPVLQLVWMPAPYRLSRDGLGFVDGAGQPAASLPSRQAMAAGERCALRAVARYGDGKYHLMSRSELEFAIVEDWISADYDADRDVYEITAQDGGAGEAEVMLVSLSSEELLASFWIESK